MTSRREQFTNAEQVHAFIDHMELNARQREVWDKGWADGQEYMRQIHVQNGYAARGMRVPGSLPSAYERENYLEQADPSGSYTAKEDEIYFQAFTNACLAGYPLLDS